MHQKGYYVQLEDQTLHNTDYRRVLYTTSTQQLVLMNLKPGEEIGMETHDLDQFIRFESGIGKVVIDEKEFEVSDGFAVIIPKGSRHNVINTGEEDLKLYSIYTPPEHKDGVVHTNKADEQEEHFDGIVSE